MDQEQLGVGNSQVQNHSFTHAGWTFLWQAGELESPEALQGRGGVLEIWHVAQGEPGGGRRRRVLTGVPVDSGLRDCYCTTS